MAAPVHPNGAVSLSPFVTWQMISYSAHVGSADVFIDDFIPISLDIGDNVAQVGATVPLAIHTVGHQLWGISYLPMNHYLILTSFQ